MSVSIVEILNPSSFYFLKDRHSKWVYLCPYVDPTLS